jgi:hypothetical protein
MIDFKSMQGLFEFSKVDKISKEHCIMILMLGGRWQTTHIMGY